MGKLKLKSSGNNPISRKVLSGLRKTIYRKVIDVTEDDRIEEMLHEKIGELLDEGAEPSK